MPKTKTAAHTREKKRTEGKNSAPFLQTSESMVLAISDIDIGPHNYRKFYHQQALEDFAGELKLHGIIAPLSVRKMPSGRYELVVGERRFRAAKLAGFTEVPVIVRTLTDQDVREIQLAENLQREDPHPLHEAIAIAQMQTERKPIEEIAVRLGKSKTFVYGRIKLVSLIDSFQEMFLANAITIQEALEIATLSAESQSMFYEAQCRKWKEQEQFQLHNLSNVLSRYRYDLRDAPFDPSDSNLLPEAGACTSCSFNSATLTTLFPELAEGAICSNRECYGRKCSQHFVNVLTQALQNGRPEAFLSHGRIPEAMQALIDSIPESAGLPVLNCYEVSVIEPPEMPAREEYEFDDGDEQTFDAAAYEEAIAEYHREWEAYQAQLEKGEFKRGLVLDYAECQIVGFVEGVRIQQPREPATVTTKEVQEAIKNKTATVEMLEVAIDRIRQGEERAKALDKEKVQEAIHKSFSNSLSEVTPLQPVPADVLAGRLIVYKSLDYATRNEVDRTLFDHESVYGASAEEDFLERLANLTDQQHCYLLRMALSAKPESKNPSSVLALCLNKVAEEAGIDLKWIQRLQDEKAETRWENKELRIRQLQKLQKKLQRRETNHEESRSTQVQISE